MNTELHTRGESLAAEAQREFDAALELLTNRLKYTVIPTRYDHDCKNFGLQVPVDPPELSRSRVLDVVLILARKVAEQLNDAHAAGATKPARDLVYWLNWGPGCGTWFVLKDDCWIISLRGSAELVCNTEVSRMREEGFDSRRRVYELDRKSGTVQLAAAVTNDTWRDRPALL